MRLKIMIALLVVSVAINFVFILKLVLTDQYRVTACIMEGHALRLRSCYQTSGSLPAVLPVGDNTTCPGECTVLYERLDDNNAIMKAKICNSMPFLTTYIGCRLDMTRCDRSDKRHTSELVDGEKQ